MHSHLISLLLLSERAYVRDVVGVAVSVQLPHRPSFSLSLSVSPLSYLSLSHLSLFPLTLPCRRPWLQNKPASSFSACSLWTHCSRLAPYLACGESSNTLPTCCAGTRMVARAVMSVEC